MKWLPYPCVFGPGLVALDDAGEQLVISPFVAGDGSGRVGGHGLMRGFRLLRRWPGVTLRAAIGLAELELGLVQPINVFQGAPERLSA